MRGWPLWQLPVLPRLYVIAVSAAAAVAAVIAAVGLSFQGRQLLLFAVLLCCGLGSVEATRRIDYSQGGIVRDLLTVWCLPVAILLPPFYALMVPGPLLALTQLRVHKGIVYRRVFSAAAIGLAYAAASWAFRSLPLPVAGPSPGEAGHAAVWCLAVAVREAGPSEPPKLELFLKASKSEQSREPFAHPLHQGSAGRLQRRRRFAWPTVLLQRRFMMHKQLVSRTRIDEKTGLLNMAAWEREATAAITRAVRTGAPLAVAIIDIDHFKAVNDSYGHLAGDSALRAVSGRFTQMMRAGDLVGRF